MKLKYIAAAFVLLSPLVAQAAPEPGVRDPGVNERQQNQGERIRQGVASGELTHNEAQELREERRDIRKDERSYKADGSLSKDERKDLHKDLHRSSRDIHQEKHDGQERPRAQ